MLKDKKYHAVTFYFAGCTSDEYTCALDTQDVCLQSNVVCNKHRDCPTEADEANCGRCIDLKLSSQKKSEPIRHKSGSKTNFNRS